MSVEDDLFFLAPQFVISFCRTRSCHVVLWRRRLCGLQIWTNGGHWRSSEGCQCEMEYQGRAWQFSPSLRCRCVFQSGPSHVFRSRYLSSVEIACLDKMLLLNEEPKRMLFRFGARIFDCGDTGGYTAEITLASRWLTWLFYDWCGWCGRCGSSWDRKQACCEWKGKSQCSERPWWYCPP